jgi:glycosyltransferase involved in cell wall biosynthesis
MQMISVPERVSVIIPSFNYGRFLGAAIESVISQTWKNVEVIVIDDGSTDNTPEVAARYPTIQYVRQQNQGRCASRNNGLLKATGEFVVFLDADDTLRPDALEAEVDLLKRHPQSMFVTGRAELVDSQGDSLDKLSPPCRDPSDPLGSILCENFIRHPACVMFRKTVFNSVAPFDSRWDPVEDFDLNFRILQHYPVVVYDGIVSDYRQHGANTTANEARMFAMTMRVLNFHASSIKSDNHRQSVAAGRRALRDYFAAHFGEEMLMAAKRLRLSRRFFYQLSVLARFAPVQTLSFFARRMLQCASKRTRPRQHVVSSASALHDQKQ